jgi:CelD/BcsL family acetyltransferase involved in cellulose biosynthesis
MNSLAIAEQSEISPSATSIVVSAHRGGPGVLDKFVGEWNELSDNAVEDQPFFRPAWVQAYLRAFEPQARVLLITARLNGLLVLILPLIEELASFKKIPVRRLRVPVNYCASRFDAVRRSGPEGEKAIEATWEYLCKLKSWDLLLFRDALEGSTVGLIADCAQKKGFRIHRVPDRPSPFIPVPSGPAGFAKIPPNSKLRSQLKQARSRIQALGQLRFSCSTRADQSALERFYRLELRGWKGNSERGLAVLKTGTQGFYDEVARSAAQHGSFTLYSLELNDNLIAAHFSLTSQVRCYSPRVAYDEHFKSFAPGHLIVSEIIGDCAKRGISGFDITGQDQPWKLKWTSECRKVSHHYIFKGHLGYLAHTVGSRVRPPEGSSWS